MGNKQRGLLGCVVCFLVPACVHCLRVGGGCGCVFGLGIKVFWQADTLSGSRSTPCERPPLLVVVACMPGLRVLFLGAWVCVVGCL